MYSKKIVTHTLVAAALAVSLAQPAFAAPGTAGPKWLDSWVSWVTEFGGGEWRTTWLEMWAAAN